MGIIKKLRKQKKPLMEMSMFADKKKENVKKKVKFTKDLKQPSKAVMMCTIGGDTFYCS